MTKDMPCPMCGFTLEIVMEPQRLQLVGDRFVVEVGLSESSQDHLETHRATPDDLPRPRGPNPMIPDTRKATKAENERMKDR